MRKKETDPVKLEERKARKAETTRLWNERNKDRLRKWYHSKKSRKAGGLKPVSCFANHLDEDSPELLGYVDRIVNAFFDVSPSSPSKYSLFRKERAIAKSRLNAKLQV